MFLVTHDHYRIKKSLKLTFFNKSTVIVIGNMHAFSFGLTVIQSKT